MKRAAVLLLLWMLFMANTASAETAITAKAQLDQKGMKVGVGTGSAAGVIVEKELPNATIEYYDDITAAYEAVAQGKIDAYVYDRALMQYAIDTGRRGVHLLDENMDETIKIAVGISPISGIPDLRAKLNAFIAGIKQDGTMDDMLYRWAISGNTVMPDIPAVKAPKHHLTVGTVGTIFPFSFYESTELSGFDIELARRFALWLDADLTFKVYDFGAIIAAAVTGHVDCIMANLNITPERSEALPFSDILFESAMGIMVRGDAPSGGSEATGPITSIDQLHGKVIGSATGTTFDALVRRRLPDVTFNYYNTFSDMVAALRAGKISAFACDEPVLRTIMAENSQVTMLPEYLDTFDYGFIFGKDPRGEALCQQLSEYIRDIKASGELQQLSDKWLDGDMDAAEMPDINALEGTNGALTLAIDALNPPFEFLRGNQYVGLDVDLALRFCQRYGYKLTIQNMEFPSVLTSVQTGKADIGASSISITEERAQQVAFSEPYYSSGTVLAVLSSENATAKPAPSGIWNSFSKTFLREQRWKLFLKGVGTTMTITLLSLLLGTLLGFAVFMLCRNGNAAANAVAGFSVWLVQGMPMVVLLMILYYIVFGSISISGIIVAVIGFTLTFGASVFGLLKMGVGAVEPGQYDAAYALGYSNTRTFFRIILPQALPHVLPAYQGEIVGLIKATSVVGYIAVQDLTKVGDIVRSRTYEAFFPLIAVTIIYFLLEGLLKRIVSRLTLHLDPRRRRPEDILKGIRTQDEPVSENDWP